jgi:hypothetical protein
MFKPRPSSAALVVATAALVVGLAAAGLGAAAPAVHGGTAPIYRSTGHTCSGGATDTIEQIGHFTAARNGDTVSGTLQLHGAARNSNFEITVVEDHPCITHSVGTLHTDGNGFGSLAYSIGVRGSASVVWVATSHNVHRIASTIVFIG